MHNRTQQQANGATETATNGTNGVIEPQVLPPYDPTLRGLPPGCIVVRREVAFALGGMAFGAIAMWFVCRDLRGK